MKLVLIFPPQKNFFRSKMVQRFIAEEAGAYPPLGLLSLATSVITKGEHEVKILDTIAENFDYPQIEDYLTREKPDIVGITLITDYLRDGVLVAKTVKKIYSETKVIVGGPHVNIYPVETIKLKEIDCAVMGDGEYVINEILARISANRSLDDLEGVVTKTNYESTKLKQLIVDDLNEFPILRRDITSYKKYISVLAKGSPITTMLTSRGCPFNCPYCAGGGIKPRSLSPERVVDEIESCIKLGIKDILFFDELFTLNKKRVLQICDEIIARSLNIRWHARARIDCVDREMIRKMKKSGCRLLQFGIESGSNRIQKILRRNLKTEKIMEVIKMVQSEGILTFGDFMFNSPTETLNEMEETIEFAKKLDLDYMALGIMSLFPKTEFYGQLLNEGKLKEDFWKLFAEEPLSYEINSTLWPGEYSFETLDNMVQKAYTEFYIRPRYILKALLRDETIYQKYVQIKSGLKVIIRSLK